MRLQRKTQIILQCVAELVTKTQTKIGSQVDLRFQRKTNRKQCLICKDNIQIPHQEE